jgi:predicted RNase H-like HicB family nuclease
MEKMRKIHVQKLPEGVYLATSDDIQELVAQGRTVWETLEIARDVARRLSEAQAQRRGKSRIREVSEQFDYPLVFSN